MMVMVVFVPASTAVVVVLVPAVTVIVIVDFMDEQVVVVFGDQLDGWIDLDEAEILRVLEQGGAVAGQDVLHRRSRHCESATRFVDDADFAPIDAGAPAHALQLHLAACFIDGFHENNAKLASFNSFQGYIHSGVFGVQAW